MKERVKQIRRYFGLTQEKFAKRINKIVGFISAMEIGGTRFSDDTIKTICSIFGINEAWLRDGVGEMFLDDAPPAADIEGIGSRIRAIRKREKLTREQFGEKIGYTKNYIYFVETGINIPSDEFLNAVTSAFGISFQWLRTGSGQTEAEDDPVDEDLIAWLRRNPDIARELRIRAGLD